MNSRKALARGIIILWIVSLAFLAGCGGGAGSGVETNVTETTGVSRKTFTGTYEVNPDCTGSAVEGSTTQDFVIVSENEVFAITTTKDPAGAQRVVTWVLKKQLPQEGT